MMHDSATTEADELIAAGPWVTAGYNDRWQALVQRIGALDDAVKSTPATQGSLLWLADSLLALRVKQLGGPPLPGGPQHRDSQPPDGDMAALFRRLQQHIQTLLDDHALRADQLAYLIEQAATNLPASDWWHVYRYAIYCLFLMIERYGQEAGRAPGEASRSLRIDLSEGNKVDLPTYLDLTFAGQPAHTLWSFIFLGTPTLTVSLGQQLIAYDHQGKKLARPHNPFAVTGDGKTRRGPTSLDMTPFSNLLVMGELIGYEVNHRLLAALEQVVTSRPGLPAADSLKALLQPIPLLLERAARDYQTFNQSSYSLPEFAYVLRQFTVELSLPPSKLWEELRGESIAPQVAATLDHFTFRLNQPTLDARLLTSLARDLDLTFATKQDPALRATAQRIAQLLRAARPEPQRLCELLIELVAQDAGLALAGREAAGLAVRILENDHEYVPSGSLSMVYAVLDVFYGLHREVPTYMSHLLSRRSRMPDNDQRFLDTLWDLLEVLPNEATCWASHLPSFYPSDGELPQLLAKIGRAHATVTSAHAGVIARFTDLPSRRFPEKFGGKSPLISKLGTGTTGMHFGTGGILASLKRERQKLLARRM